MPGKVQEKTKSPARKKTSSKTKSSGSTKTKKTSSSRSKMGTKSGKTSADKQYAEQNPFYVLAIMLLLTVIALLLNKFYINNNSQSSSVEEKKDIITATESIVDDLEAYTTEKKDIQRKEGDGNKNISLKQGLKTHLHSEKNIRIYLLKYNNKTEKISLTAVTRRIKSNNPLRRALEELIKGPNRIEEQKGLLSAIPNNLKINNIRIINKEVELDFDKTIEENANGDILISRIDQIVYTATQFDTIDRVKIKINGNIKNFIGGEGLSINTPIQRRRE